MADNGPPSEVSLTAEKSKMDETLIECEVKAVTEATAQNSDESGEETLELAEELLHKGTKAMKDSDFIEAVDCFSRALEIRAAHYGELAPECVKLYYKYGCALLYKAQEEADPLGAVPKKEGESLQESDKDESVIKNATNGELSKASLSSNVELVDGVTYDIDVSSKMNQNDEEADDSDAEDIPDADEDEADLDLAWKMLDLARAIVEKDSGDKMEIVDILSALAEVALEREDTETSLGDYKKALSILEKLVEPDNRRLAELNFRLCLCLEFGSQPEEAITFCQKALSICKSCVLRHTDEINSIAAPMEASSTSGSEPEVPLSNGSHTDSDNAATEKQSEIETLSELLVELEKKLEDLEHLASNPKSILSEILGRIESAKVKDEKIRPPLLAVLNSSKMGSANSGGGFDSTTVSTAHTNDTVGVMHLGIVGRGIKRVSTKSESAEDSTPRKKLAIDSLQDKS